MSTDTKTTLAAVIAFALMGGAAQAATVIDQRIVDTRTDLIGTTERIVEEKGVRYKVTDEKYKVTTTTKRTLQDSYNRRVYNDRDYDYRLTAGWSNIETKWYESNVNKDGGLAEGTRTLSWGKNDSQSRFDMTTRRGSNVDTGDTVTIGQLVHTNNRIKGGVTDGDLNMGLDLWLDGGYKRFDWTFDMSHIESWNWFHDVEDKASFSDERFSRSFNIAGVDYTFSLLGFFDSYGYNQSWTLEEGHYTQRDLRAKLTSVEWKTFYKTTTDFLTNIDHFTKTTRMELPSEVPLPAGLPLLLAGLGVMGVMKHRKNKV